MACFGIQAFKGEYSWMLYGDDDTFFFLDNILELLQDFDPNMPYIITGVQLDNQQFGCIHCLYSCFVHLLGGWPWPPIRQVTDLETA